METWKTKMSTRDGRANGDAASQPAKIMEVVTDLQVPVESMELYDEVDGPPIFDVYDEEEQIYNNVVPFSHIYGDGDVAVLGCDCVMQESSFAHSPRSNEFFKEFIDVSHIEAVITRLWIRRVAPKTYVPSISAPTHPNHIHELLTSTPKKLNEEHPVSDRTPPLRDKKIVAFMRIRFEICVSDDDEEFVCSCEMEANERLCDYDEAMKISSTVEGHKQQHLRLLRMTEKLLQEFSDKSRVKGLDVDALYIYTSKCTKQHNRDGGHIILMEINRMFFFMPH
ncbi:hypothetical protein F2Q70_00038748 [Brassica cretica]|uniref:Uncharacterized protein n=1 Tax=Brassica cretica TaxID=69181 RepID=A0A8S9KAF5_BRACR|nr:hypothetical protein F2Q70_00038748 [Brassica cretica]